MNKLNTLWFSPWPAFLVLLLFNIGIFSYCLSDGSLMKQMGMAVDYLNQGYAGKERETMVLSFVAISIAYYVLMTAALAISLHFSVKSNRFAIVVFLCLVGITIYQTATNPHTLSSMYPGTVSTFDWGSAIVQTLIWGFVGFRVVQRFVAKRKELQHANG